jgi:hypothetical protein
MLLGAGSMFNVQCSKFQVSSSIFFVILAKNYHKTRMKANEVFVKADYLYNLLNLAL